MLMVLTPRTAKRPQPRPKRATFTQGLGELQGDRVPPSAFALTEVQSPPPTPFRLSLSPPDPEIVGWVQAG